MANNLEAYKELFRRLYKADPDPGNADLAKQGDALYAQLTPGELLEFNRWLNELFAEES